jgi:hypothetical protein
MQVLAILSISGGRPFHPHPGGASFRADKKSLPSHQLIHLHRKVVETQTIEKMV